MLDILLDINFDLRIEGGDFKAGESARQHQQLLILTEKGELREFPTRGVGIQSWLLDDIQVGDLNSAVKREFEADGMTVVQVKKGTSPGRLQIEAYYA
jgi:hypothetical protein